MEVKILDCYATPKLLGDKPFEIRFNDDRGYQKGDLVQYEVIDKLGLHVNHELNSRLYQITYVTNYNQKEGYVVYADRDVTESINQDISSGSNLVS